MGFVYKINKNLLEFANPGPGILVKPHYGMSVFLCIGVFVLCRIEGGVEKCSENQLDACGACRAAVCCVW